MKLQRNLSTLLLTIGDVVKVTCSIDRLIQITREQWREQSAAGVECNGPGSADQPLVVERRAAIGGLQSAHTSYNYHSGQLTASKGDWSELDLSRGDDGFIAAA